MENQTLQRYLHYLKQDPDNTNLLLSISQNYQNQQNWPLAQHYLDQAKKSSNQALWLQQGLLHLSAENHEEAIAVFEKALQERDLPQRRYYLAYSYSLQKNYAYALELLMPLEASSEILVMKARLLQRLERFEESIELIRTVAHYEQNAELLGILAASWFELENEHEAVYYAKLCLSLNDTNREAQLVMLFLDEQTTLTDIEVFIAVDSANFRLWYHYGVKQMEKHQLPDAQASLEKSLHLNEQFYPAWIGLGWCYLLMNDLSEAQRCYHSATRLEPLISEAWSGLALLAILNQDWEKVSEYINKAREQNPQCSILALADALFSSHQPLQAA
ncbi:tetratricopeptide repeat protein [Legionella genomosp. 1]|uniref:tetratricopeptide repeat protein n=1 Tax=Legionella genomosp. 1 TaxID=1093625 RepID=UPI0010544ECA|nr:tetratricopeptide repeat protein [Legionella genomosp. 1]